MKKYLLPVMIMITCMACTFGMNACKKNDQKGLIGIVVPVGQDMVKKDAPYAITGVYEGSPAYKAGLRPDDRIKQVNGVEVDGLRYDYIYNNLLRGPSGTKVTIVIERAGETLVFDVLRGE